MSMTHWPLTQRSFVVHSVLSAQSEFFVHGGGVYVTVSIGRCGRSGMLSSSFAMYAISSLPVVSAASFTIHP